VNGLAALRVNRVTARAALLLVAWLGFTPAARAVMDIEDRGPQLNAGRYAFRPTNIGVLGNAFYDVGRSFDPSFEYPRGSGIELLKHADLWVGALDENGRGRVSGGPLLEWRPTLDPSDKVRLGWRGQPGSRRGVDDDGDGKVDEELLNGKDDDGDGEIDEDLGFPSDEMAASDYRDTQPEAVNYGYPNGEVHRPLGLEVHEEEYCSSLPGYESIVGVQYTITNRGNQTLRQVYLGVLADLDVRLRAEATGHLDDLVEMRTWQRTIFEGISSPITIGGIVPQDLRRNCTTLGRQTVPVVKDGVVGTTMPVVSIVGEGHTTDPLASLDETRAYARAPSRESFRYGIFRQDLPPAQGGPPVLDEDRYAALAGTFPQNPSLTVLGDQSVLVACGPFSTLQPGQSLSFAVALCAAPDPDSLVTVMGNAFQLYHGFTQNRLRDTTGTEWNIGATGKNGHEVCIDPPPGVTFYRDPNCDVSISNEVLPPDDPVLYEHGHCVWTNADCNICTGMNGLETRVNWLDPGSVPPPPAYHVAPEDHRVTLTWDNQPEILLNAGIAGAGDFHFTGYRLYRLSDWRDRHSQLPPPERWEQIAGFGSDSINGMRPLAQVLDTTTAYDLIRYGQKHYPIGRYRFVDDHVLDGFDYLYLITTVATKIIQGNAGTTTTQQIESPLVPVLDSVVVPHHRSTDRSGAVWVVPNPYRGGAAWDRPNVPGDVFGRHVDFFGLPSARATIKIYTLAGDLVAQLDHDGTRGDGEAPWNLISRNGQDVESGIYLFTVDSKLGHQVGRFVIIR